MRSFAPAVFAIALLSAPGAALAQGAGTTEGTPTGSGDATSGEKPAADAPKGSGTTGGYSYRDKAAPRATGKRARALRKPTGPVVNMPGFEQTADGGSRLFVQLSSSVPVEERKGQGTITYVLKGAHARVRNNLNALVTVHFNTPVSRARLVPQGNDLLFVVDLRAQAVPTFKMTEGQDKSAVLQIDFPKGDFAASDAPASAGPGESSGERGEAGAAGSPANGTKKGVAKPAPAATPKPAGPTP